VAYEAQSPPGSRFKQIHASFSNCVHCKTCEIKDALRGETPALPGDGPFDFPAILFSLMNNDDPIGVLDSGFGGLNVLAWALRVAPGERFIYYGDFAHAPYGSKPPAQVAAFVDEACAALLARGAKALALACNTATSAAVAELRARLAVPVIGMEPALKPAALAHPRGRILVMATELTLRERKFRDLMARVAGDCVVDGLACPGLASLIDRGDLMGAANRVRDLLDGCPAATRATAVVLGCSHYAFVAGAIRQWHSGLGREIGLFDGAEGTARRLAAALAERGLAAPRPAKPAPARERVELILQGGTGETHRTAWRLLDMALRMEAGRE